MGFVSKESIISAHTPGKARLTRWFIHTSAARWRVNGRALARTIAGAPHAHGTNPVKEGEGRVGSCEMGAFHIGATLDGVQGLSRFGLIIGLGEGAGLGGTSAGSRQSLSTKPVGSVCQVHVR